MGYLCELFYKFMAGHIRQVLCHIRQVSPGPKSQWPKKQGWEGRPPHQGTPRPWPGCHCSLHIESVLRLGSYPVQSGLSQEGHWVWKYAPD